MARRWQIMKKTAQGIFRATVDTEEGLREIVDQAQSDPDTKYIVVKDRVSNKRGLVWRRTDGEEIAWWILEDAQPEITYKNTKTRPDPTDLP